MDFQLRDRNQVREILRASEGIPSQTYPARIENARVSPAPSGHALANHLHSVAVVEGKTKFVALDDMVEALWLLLQLPASISKIRALPVGGRDTLVDSIPQLFGIECEASDPQGRGTLHRVRFTPIEQRRAGRSNTNCVAVIEARERAGQAHLQIHSFYPRLGASEIQSLLQSIRNQPTR